MGAYEWLIGTRYLRSTHRRGFVSFVALMSVCGLTLGGATLIVVLSVMNGFERGVRSRVLAVTAHATIMGRSGTLATPAPTTAARERRAGGGPVHREPGDAGQRAAPGGGERARRAARGGARRHRPGAACDCRQPRCPQGRRLRHHSRQRAGARTQRARGRFGEMR